MPRKKFNFYFLTIFCFIDMFFFDKKMCFHHPVIRNEKTEFFRNFNNTNVIFFYAFNYFQYSSFLFAFIQTTFYKNLISVESVFKIGWMNINILFNFWRHKVSSTFTNSLNMTYKLFITFFYLVFSSFYFL